MEMRAGNGWAMGAEGSGGAKRGWACIGLALDCLNDSNTSHTCQGPGRAGRWALRGEGLGKQGWGMRWACSRLLKWFKYFTYLTNAEKGWAVGAGGIGVELNDSTTTRNTMKTSHGGPVRAGWPAVCFLYLLCIGVEL